MKLSFPATLLLSVASGIRRVAVSPQPCAPFTVSMVRKSGGPGSAAMVNDET
jgi:hypothetical protein